MAAETVDPLDLSDHLVSPDLQESLAERCVNAVLVFQAFPRSKGRFGRPPFSLYPNDCRLKRFD